jgi:putative MATE family efflux protein
LIIIEGTMAKLSTVDLTQGEEKKLLYKMTIPMVWGLLAAIGMSLADTFCVGKLGAKELAAIGFTFPIVMITMSLAFGFGIGASSLVSRAIGSKDQIKAQIYTTQSLIVVGIVSIIVGVVGWMTIKSVFSVLGAPYTLLGLIEDYMEIWYLGLFSTMILLVSNAAIRSTGNVILPTRIMIGAAVLNLILDPIFIFGKFGLPQMGLFGAALASFIASLLAMSVSLYLLSRKLSLISFKDVFQNFKKYSAKILKLALPAALASLIAPIGMVIATRLVSSYGNEAIAGFSVAVRIESFSLIIIMALSGVLTPFAGQNWGAKQIDRLVKGLKSSFMFSAIWTVIVTCCMWFFGTSIVSLFSNQAEVISTGSLYLFIVPISYGAVGIIMIVSSVANGIGYTKPALFLSITRLILIYWPLAILLSNYYQLTGLYIATTVSNSIVGIVALSWTQKMIRSIMSYNI